MDKAKHVALDSCHYGKTRAIVIEPLEERGHVNVDGEVRLTHQEQLRDYYGEQRWVELRLPTPRLFLAKLISSHFLFLSSSIFLFPLPHTQALFIFLFIFMLVSSPSHTSFS